MICKYTIGQRVRFRLHAQDRADVTGEGVIVRLRRTDGDPRYRVHVDTAPAHQHVEIGCLESEIKPI
jgi:hypothetical protein